MPTYIPNAKQIKIPTTENLQMLIAKARQLLSIKLTVSKETGLRPVELMSLKVKDIDLEHNTVYPTTAKHGSARILKISKNLTKNLQDHIILNNLNSNNKLFKGTPDNYGKQFRDMRNRLAKKLKNPIIKTIRLYDFRHYFATMLYAKTKDILYVKQQMGHRKIATTLIYTQLLHINEEDEYTCKTVTNAKEATQLIENGFQYVTTTPDALMLFKKCK